MQDDHRATEIEMGLANLTQPSETYERRDGLTIRKTHRFPDHHIDVWRDGEAAPSYLGTVEGGDGKGWQIRTAMGHARTKTDMLRLVHLWHKGAQGFEDALAELLKHKSDRPAHRPWDLVQAERAGTPPLGEQLVEVWIADPGHGQGFNAYWAGNSCTYCAERPLDPSRLRAVACSAPRQHAELNVSTWAAVVNSTTAHVRTVMMSRAELLTAYGTAEQAEQARTAAAEGSAAGLILLPHSGMRVPHTRLKVTGLRQLGTSRGVAYTATLRLDSKIVGTIENGGYGGETMFEPRSGAGFGYDEINEYAGPCCTVGGWNSTESVLDDLVDEFETARLVARNIKAGKLTCRLLCRVADDSTDTFTVDYALLKATVAPQTPEQLATLGRNCHRFNPATPGKSWWQVWDAAAQRWIYLPGTLDPSLSATTEAGR